jgi:hypothetical protein
VGTQVDNVTGARKFFRSKTPNSAELPSGHNQPVRGAHPTKLRLKILRTGLFTKEAQRTRRRKFENMKLCVLCASAVSPSYFHLVAALGCLQSGYGRPLPAIYRPRTVRTGQVASDMTLPATLPIKSFDRPVRP